MKTNEILKEQKMDIDNLLVLPALIDPHVHFRTPGAQAKEDWRSGALSAIHGGVTTVFDMPNNTPSCTTKQKLLEKKIMIDTQLSQAEIPLRYFLYFGADKAHFEEIPSVAKEVIGIKVFMGSSTGNLLIDDPILLQEIFKIAAACDLPVAVHAEDEEIIRNNKRIYQTGNSPLLHGRIRDRLAAIKAVEKALSIAEMCKTRICILHVTTKEELHLISHAKAKGMEILAEATPHHLFLDESAYEELGTLAIVNPPLRKKEDREALWEGIQNGVIDYIGSDHAPHLLHEKKQPFGDAPSGVPGIEFILPLLLNAFHLGWLSLAKIEEITSRNIRKFFRLPPCEDRTYIDLELVKTITQDDIKSKCKWSPYLGYTLRGWPIMTSINDKHYLLSKEQCHTLAQSLP